MDVDDLPLYVVNFIIGVSGKLVVFEVNVSGRFPEKIREHIAGFIGHQTHPCRALLTFPQVIVKSQ
jgi:hypothetical protein